MEAKLVRQVWNSTCLKAETSPAFTDQIAELVESTPLSQSLMTSLVGRLRAKVPSYLESSSQTPAQ